MNKNSIYGAIIGDIAGSYLEVEEIIQKQNNLKPNYNSRCKILSKTTPLFNDNCSLTDDSVLTIAIADAILTGNSYEQKLKEYGKKEINMGQDKYGRSRFGKCFCQWIYGNFKGDSFGNGCAMRISPIAYMYNSLEKTLKEAEIATICSHNHPDSIKCAKATCGAIWLAKNGASKTQIKNFVEKELAISVEYDLEYLRHNYVFSSKAMLSVPQAIYCFLVSNNFEDTLRNTLSIGGDVDTTAAISCAIASAYYDIPLHILQSAKKFIPKGYDAVLQNFSKKYLENNNEPIKR